MQLANGTIFFEERVPKYELQWIILDVHMQYQVRGRKKRQRWISTREMREELLARGISPRGSIRDQESMYKKGWFHLKEGKRAACGCRLYQYPDSYSITEKGMNYHNNKPPAWIMI